MHFFLGTHEPLWLFTAGVPLFVSSRRLRRHLPRSGKRALAPWALDSGGFSELVLYGGWRTPPDQYVREVRTWSERIGNLQWAAPQDWMCEPAMLARTGLTVAEHQRRTVANLIELRTLAPELPWIPVVQGFEPDDYSRCVELYQLAGVDLYRERLIGVGTVCRRQAMPAAGEIFRRLQAFPLHAFGLKLTGIKRWGGALVSTDSMAWSLAARKNPGIPGHTHKTCANCLEYALRWRERVRAITPEFRFPS